MPLPLSDIQKHDFSEHYIALLLSLLGVVQGLALNHLADNIIIFGKAGDKSSKILRTTVYIMCFFIIVRVFQTYYSAAFERAQQQFTIIDLSSIFAVGLLQYWVIDAIQENSSETEKVFFRVIFLAMAAVILHFITGVRIWGAKEPDPELSEKMLLQFLNVGVAASIALIAFFGSRKRQIKTEAVFAATISALLIINIEISLYLSKLF